MRRYAASPGQDVKDLQHCSIEANGFRLHYVVAGQGRPMVLLHGDSASALDWRWVLPDLARQARVHALDFPGHGDSAKPRTPYSPKRFTDTVIAFLNALGIDEAVLVGHSLGGLVAVRTARRLSGRVSALCLVASAGVGRYIHPAIAGKTLPGVGETAAALGRTGLGSYQRAWGRALLLFARWWEAPAEWLAEQRRLMTLPGFAEASLRTTRSAVDAWGQKELILGELHQLHMPTLVVWGGADTVFPLPHALAAYRAPPAARLRILPGCGHMAQIEAPATFVETLTGFLADHELL
jgi:pimeloyl-ACP methyl ester carboxylesterase